MGDTSRAHDHPWIVPLDSDCQRIPWNDYGVYHSKVTKLFWGKFPLGLEEIEVHPFDQQICTEDLLCSK